MNDFVRSLIRTGVPYIVGALFSWLTAQGVTLSAEAETGLIAFLTALFGGVYFLIVRALESRWPRVGVLLGATGSPSYGGARSEVSDE